MNANLHSDIVNRPLISMCITSYNQVMTIRGAVESALSQTYSPLEIVICDDASTDGTDKVISEVIADYRKTNGSNTVIFKRNEANLGIVKNYEQCFLLAHGELLVTCSGDDVSMPNRVERLVSAWGAGGKKATIIHHAWYAIDLAGRFMGCEGPRDSSYTLGACSAYRRDVFAHFPRVVELGGYEDMIFCARACMLGDTLRIDDKLVCYRYGGTTTMFHNHFDMVIRNVQRDMSSLSQMALDVEYAKCNFDSDRIMAVEANNMRRRADAIKRLEFFNARGTRERWKVGRRNRLIVGPRSLFVWGVYCFPKWIGDLFGNAYFGLYYLFKLYKCRFDRKPKDFLTVEQLCRLER